MTEQNAREAMEVWLEAYSRFGIAHTYEEGESAAASVIAAKLAEKDAALENAITVAGQAVQALDTERAAHEAAKAELQIARAMQHAYALDKKEAEVELQAMREAIKPFADCVDQIGDDEPDEEWAKFRLLIKDYRRAYSALTRKDA